METTSIYLFYILISYRITNKPLTVEPTSDRQFSQQHSRYKPGSSPVDQGNPFSLIKRDLVHVVVCRLLIFKG